MNDSTIKEGSVFIKEVSSSWGKNSTVNNLRLINICIYPKKLYVIVGPIGSGKVKYTFNILILLSYK
jgi:ABC-type lipoprotein export system ATPase subunit